MTGRHDLGLVPWSTETLTVEPRLDAEDQRKEQDEQDDVDEPVSR